jgi:hypothetical protein
MSASKTNRSKTPARLIAIRPQGRQPKREDDGAETSTRLAKKTRTQGETWVLFFPATRNCRFAATFHAQADSCLPSFSWA